MRHFASRVSGSLALVPVLSLFAAACGGDGGKDLPAIGFNADAIADLEAAGVNKYVGAFTPTPGEEVTRGDVTTYYFDKANGAGPICLWGEGYRASIRDMGSENLLIYLEGGGACRTGLCAANTTAGCDPQADPLCSAIASSGILDENAATNVVASWNVVYVPYCDGSVHSGDNELQTTDALGQPATRYHRGLRNLTAALDLAKAHFPNPKRILLAGSSAGGYGTIMGTALARFEYPETDLIVFNDAGVGLTPPEPGLTEMKNEWKFEQFIPSSCAECAGGNFTAVIGWGLENDPSLRVSMFSSYEDGVIGGVFFGITGAEFKSQLLQKTGGLHDAYPERAKRFFINGTEHTALILNTGDGATLGGYLDVSEGVSLSEWNRAFVDDTAGWVDHLEQ